MLENLGLVEIDQLKLLNTRFHELEENGMLDTYKKEVTAEHAKAEAEKWSREQVLEYTFNKITPPSPS